MKEIILPPHLYDRIRASAGEHGGIGWGALFSREGTDNCVPLCAHGHAWGTFARHESQVGPSGSGKSPYGLLESEMGKYLSWRQNDRAVSATGVAEFDGRISFERWCELLNVRRGKDEDYIQAPSEQDAEREASLV